MKKKSIITVIFIFSIFIALILIYIKNNSTNEDFKRLVVGRYNDVITLDPSIATDNESINVAANIFETLVRSEQDGSKIMPGLAESWKVSEDGLTWTFKLRKNIKFHDGSRLDAKVVAFNFNRWMDEESPYHTGLFSYWSYTFGGFPGIVKSVVPLSEDTVEIILTEPYAPFLNALSIPSFGIASMEAIIKYNENLKRHPVGTGPFKLKSWTPEESVVLERFDDYWGARAKVNELEFKVIPTSLDNIELLKSGEIHIIDHLRPNEVADAPNHSDIKVYYRPYFNIGYLALNNEIEPFNDVNVRIAIAHLIDHEKMVNKVFNTLSRPANSFLPPTIMGYHEGIKMPSFDLKLAKKHLAMAGYPDGFKTTLWLMDKQRNYFPDPQALGLYLKDQFIQAEIEVDLKIIPWESFIDVVKEGNHPMALVGWNGDIVDPDNFLYTLFASENTMPGLTLNYSFYKNSIVDKMLIQSRRATNIEFRRNLYRKVQEQIESDMVSIPLTHTMTAIGASSRVVGFIPNLSGIEIYNRVDLLDLGDDHE